VIVEKEVERVVTVEKPVIVEKEVERVVTVEKPVIVEKEVERVVTVEKPVIVERIVQRPVVVEKIVTKTVEVEVPAKAKPIVKVLMDTDWARGTRGQVTAMAAEAFNDQFAGRILLDVRLDIAEGGDTKQRALTATGELGSVLLTVSWKIPNWTETGLFNVDIQPFFRQLNIDLDKMLFLDEHLKYKNRVGGLPMQFNGFDWVYNKSRFDENGVDYPNNDWTWDDFLDAAKQLTHPEKEQWGARNVGEHSLWMPMVFANGGEFWDETNGKCILDSPEAAEALEMNLDMINKHQVAAPYLQAREKRYSFYQGHYAMMMANSPGGNWNWRPDAVGGKFEWDVFHMPLFKRTGLRATQLNEQPYYVTRFHERDDNLLESIQVVAFHAGPVVQGMIADVGGATPAWKSILDSNRYMPPPQTRQVVIDSFNWREGMKPHLFWYEWWIAVNPPFREGLEGKVPALTAVRQMTDIGNAAIEKARAAF
jgi:ABC-type glycerol-3-phosphate transport system substrate-binding protein